VIEDFFRLLMDALLFYPLLLLPSMLFPPIVSAALTALTLQQCEPLVATLHFLRDVLAYGTPNPPSSSTSTSLSTPAPHQPARNPPEIQQLVRKVILSEGETLVQRILTGMMFSFPRDCFPDASGVLLGLVELCPGEVSGWIARTVGMLPQGTVSRTEMERLIGGVEEYVS
jgi:transportin-3